MSEEATVQEQEAPQEQAPNLMALLKEFKGAPDQAQIDAWKQQYGEVFISGFSEDEVFIWRPICRPEYIEVQTKLQDPKNDLNQWDLEELICDTAVLWKSKDVDWKTGKAGTPQSLSEQIMSNSNFMSPQAASMLVAKL